MDETKEMLFEEALSRPPEERAAFLGQAVAGRPELRAAVEALLAAHERPGTSLDKSHDPIQTVGFRSWPAHPDATLDHTPEPERRRHPATGTADYRPTSGAGIVIAGPVHAPGEDRRRGHGRGLGRQADRAGQAQGRAQADQGRHGFRRPCWPASSRSGRRWR